MRKRKLIIALTSVLMLPASGVHALGLGDIKLDSALNQPLDAKIALVAVQPGELNDAVVGLASREAFIRSGVERAPVLRQIKFTVRRDDNGRPFVHATSQEPIREPFLDFLLEVNWPSGRIVREYTLLLDPPIFSSDQAVPVQPAATPAPKPQARPQVRPRPAAAPRAPVAQPPRQARPVAPPQQQQQRVVAGNEVGRSATGEIRYGPTKRNDTLWEIAEKMRTDGSVTMPQMMIALLNHNPEAFYRENVNNLKAGYILRLPNGEVAKQIPAKDAERAFKVQYETWVNAKRGVGPRNLLAQGEGKPQVASPGGGAAAKSGQNGARLQLVSPEVGEGSARGGAGTSDPNVQGAVAELRKQLQLAVEEVEAQRLENAELQSRMSGLEKQIVTMRDLLTIESKELAALQAETQAQSEQAVEAIDPVTAQTEPATTEETAEQSSAAAGGESGTVPAGEEGAQQAEVAATSQEVTEPVVKPVAKPKVQPLPIEEESGILDSILGAFSNRTTQYALGGIGIFFLIIWGYQHIRRQRLDADTSFDDLGMGDLSTENLSSAGSSTADANADAVSPALAEGEDELGLAVSGDNLDDEIASGALGEIQSEQDEVTDPIAEADVYLAYRRYHHAEALVREAIRNDPEREDLKLKLMEIYFAAKNRDAFETQAESLYAIQGGEGNPLWDKISVMGRELCPDHPLFMGATGLEDDADGVDEEFSLDLDQELAGDETDLGAETIDASLDDEIEFSPAEESEEDLSLDLDFAEDSLDDLVADSTEGDEHLDLMSDATEDINETLAEESPLAAGDDLDMNLEDDLNLGDDLDVDLDLEGGVEQAIGSLGEVGDLDVDDGSLESAIEETALDDDVNLDFELDDVMQNSNEDVVAEGSLDIDAAPEMDVDDLLGEEVGVSSGESGFDLGDLDGGLGDLDMGELGDLDELAGGDLDELGSLDDEGLDSDDFSSIFGNGDAVGTKLDLARAYMDMGDEEGARSILDEVMQEGNDEQVQSAQELMAQIA